MTWSDLHWALRASLLIVLGVVALVTGAVQGWWEAAGIGLISLLVGCAGLAGTIWEVRHPPRRLQAGYATDDRSVHHLVRFGRGGEPERGPDRIIRALCGAGIEVVDNRRLSKADGQACWPCITVLEQLRDKDR